MSVITLPPSAAATRKSARECFVTTVPFGEWDELVGRLPGHTVFHSLPWLETVAAAFNATLVLTKANLDGACVAAWPIFYARKGPLRLTGSPLPGWNTPYLGPLFAEGCDVNAALSAFFNHDLFRRGAYFATRTSTEGPPVDLAPFGFVQTYTFDTYILDISRPVEEVWNTLKSECRSRIRKARQLGLEVRQETDDSFIDEYWSMTLDTFANTHIKPTFSRHFLEEMWRRLHPKGSVYALSAWRGDERMGTLVLPFDDVAMYYWSGASYVRNRGIPAHNLLHWSAIELAQNHGLQRYDFIATLGGAGRFKKTFGPEAKVTAIHWDRTSSRLIRMLRNRYEQYVMWRHGVKA